MTKEQIEKARIALLRHDNMERLKALKLSEHERATALVSAVSLPYKVIKANLNTWRLAPDSAFLLPVACTEKIEISTFYPKRKPDAVQFRAWLRLEHPDVYASACSSPAAWLGWAYSADKATKKDSDGKPIVDFVTCQSDAYAALEQEFYFSRRGFKDDNERRSLFGHFLCSVDIDALTAFELWGDKAHSPEETAVFKRQLKDLQTDYLQNPGAYYQPTIEQDEPPAATADDLIGMGEVQREGET